MTHPSSAIGTVRRQALGALVAIAISATASATARADDLEWNDDWTRFQAWDYAATTVFWTQGLLVRFAGPSMNRERGTFELDERITSALSVSGTTEDVAEAVANVGYVGSVAYRLVDSTVVPGLFWGNRDVAIQMTLIDLEAFGFSAFVLWTAQLIYGRERPRYRDCPGSAPAVDCENQKDERFRAFIAGHTLITTTAAALTCVHHSHLPLYGGGAADALACGGLIGVAAAVGIARIMQQKHYATDTLLAWVIGTFSGYVLPSALHYGFDDSPPLAAKARRAPPDAVRLTVIPGVGTTTTGATFAGTF
jgi:membrane-associated phospholipid phosphatase